MLGWNCILFKRVHTINPLEYGNSWISKTRVLPLGASISSSSAKRITLFPVGEVKRLIFVPGIQTPDCHNDTLILGPGIEINNKKLITYVKNFSCVDPRYFRIVGICQ